MQVATGKSRDSGLIAGHRRLLDVRSVQNIYRRRSRPRTTGYRSIAGRANYEVTKQLPTTMQVSIAQSATHHQM